TSMVSPSWTETTEPVKSAIAPTGWSRNRRRPTMKCRITALSRLCQSVRFFHLIHKPCKHTIEAPDQCCKLVCRPNQTHQLLCMRTRRIQIYHQSLVEY